MENFPRLCYYLVMMPDMKYPADNLEDAYLALDPRQPVQRHELDQLFVARPDSPTQKLQTALRLQSRQASGPKVLFVGHRGAGKTTELNYLASQLEGEFVSVQVPAYDIYQKPDISHIELIYAMNLRLLQVATDESVVPRGVVTAGWEKLLESVYQPLKRTIFGEKPIAADERPSVTLRVAVLAAELETKIGTEDLTRRQIKERYAGNVNELIKQFDEVAAKLKQVTGKNVLMMVDGLEKFDLKDMKNLFTDHSRTLTTPTPAILYTFPVALQYKGDYTQIKQSFDRVDTLPNISINHRDGTPDEVGRGKLAEIILRRVTKRLFQPDTLETAVLFSGGHVKTLIQLLRFATLEAVVNGDARVGKEHLQVAMRRLRSDYMQMLKPEDHDVLRTVRADPVKDLSGAEGPYQELLYNGSLLEYANTRGPWVNVIPIVSELLDILDEEAATRLEET